MNLEDVRREMRERAGTIKAWALHGKTVVGIAVELGIGVEAFLFPVSLFGIPVVFVDDDQPEGIIV